VLQLSYVMSGSAQSKQAAFQHTFRGQLRMPVLH